MWVAVYILEVELNMFSLHTSPDVFLGAFCLLVTSRTDWRCIPSIRLPPDTSGRGQRSPSLGLRPPDRPHYSQANLSLPVIFLYPGIGLSLDLTSGLANGRKLCRIFYKEFFLYTCSSDSLILVIQNCNIEIENCVLIFIWFFVSLKQKSWNHFTSVFNLYWKIIKYEWLISISDNQAFWDIMNVLIYHLKYTIWES